jgi:uncharacterized protein
MIDLRDQLLRLRSQAGASATITPVDTQDPLRQLLSARIRQFQAATHLDRDLPGQDIAPGLRFVERFFAGTRAPPITDLRFAGMATCAPEQLLFFDAETTGLAGGTGTRAFMIGAADWQASGLRIRQLCLTKMSAETTLLETFATWLKPSTILVSYNGRSFDSPLLVARFRLARLPAVMDELPHLDLLYATRRRYRGEWDNCKLATIERQVLGIERDDDLPGAKAPQAWHDFLRGRSATDLRRVFAHNQQDLLSLHALLQRLIDLASDDLYPLRPRLLAATALAYAANHAQH